MKTYDKTVYLGKMLEKKSQCYSLYSVYGICPTISSGIKRYGGLPTFILEYDET